MSTYEKIVAVLDKYPGRKPLADVGDLRLEYDRACQRQEELRVLRHDARKAASKAISQRRLIRPPLCTACKKPSERTLHFHHHRGYAPENWLCGVWLCSGCHGRQPEVDDFARADELNKQLREYIEPAQRWTASAEGPYLRWGALDGLGDFHVLSLANSWIPVYEPEIIDEYTATVESVALARSQVVQARYDLGAYERVVRRLEQQLASLPLVTPLVSPS